MASDALGFIEDGEAWLFDQLKEHASRLVTYVRAYDSVLLAAVKGSKPMRVEGDFGPRIEWTGQDFIIGAADLRLGGELVEPMQHDQIIETRDGWASIYEVLSPGSGEAPWRWSDDRVSYRIHTKRIGRERDCLCPS